MKPSDSTVYEKYVAWCERIGVRAAAEDVWRETTRSIKGQDLAVIQAGVKLPPEGKGV